MLDELQYINYWLNSKDPYLMRKHDINSSYFIVLNDIVTWIEKFRDTMKGVMPSVETVAVEFEDFKILKDLDPIDYTVNKLRQKKAYVDYRPILIDNAHMVENGQTLEAMWKMRSRIDDLLKNYTGTITHYDWVKNAEERYEKYMEKHGDGQGLAGIPTGINGLDKLMGGIKNDDLLLIAGRTNEGKSQVGTFFAYHAWRFFQLKNLPNPVVYISTEMPELEVAFRLDTLKAHFRNRELNEGKLENPSIYKEYLEGLAKYNNSFYILTQEANNGNPFTPTDIKAIISEYKPGLIVIDQLYDLSDGLGERDIRKKIVNVTNGIREVNLYTQTPTILIAQAGRESARDAKKDKNASPELYQIQESDNPAQKATRVLTLRKIDDIFKISLKKNRGGKNNANVYVRADLDTGVWEEIAEEELVF